MLRAKWLRLEAGMTQAELAKKAGVSTRTVEHLEQGLSAGSDITLIKLAKALDVAPTKFGTLRHDVPVTS